MVPDRIKVRPVNWKGKPVMGATLGKQGFATMYFSVRGMKPIRVPFKP
jgi:hypothetical protein